MSRNGVSNTTQERVDREGSPQNEYPYQKVIQLQGGIKIVYGDEKDKQFVRLLTPSGSGFEIYPDGKIQHVVVGDSKTYHKGGVSFTIDENNDVKIHGHNKLVVAGGAHIEVAGDAGIAVGGNTALVGMGDMGIDVKSMYLGVRGDFALKVEGSTLLDTQGRTTINSGQIARLTAPRFVQDAVVDLGGEGGQLLHRKGDIDSDGDAAVTSASRVRAI